MWKRWWQWLQASWSAGWSVLVGSRGTPVILRWDEKGPEALSWCPPLNKGTQEVLVQEGQLALLLSEGQIDDLLPAGRHPLDQGTSPQVMFVSQRDFINQKWGTAQPAQFSPSQQLRAFGTYSYAIKNPAVYLKKVAGTREVVLVEELDGILRSLIFSALHQALGLQAVQAVPQPHVLAPQIRTVAAEGFAGYGLELRSFLIQSLSLRDAVGLGSG